MLNRTATTYTPPDDARNAAEGKSSASSHAVPAPPNPPWAIASPTNAHRRSTTKTLRAAHAIPIAHAVNLDHLIGRLGVKTIAPTHGLPITDVAATVPKVQEGLKAAALMPESGTNEKAPLSGAAAS
jgi:hypothetical protein